MFPRKILQRNLSPTDTPTDGQVLTFDNALQLWLASDGGGGKLELIDFHQASTTEADFTFTFSPALDMVTDFAYLIVIIDGLMTAQAALEMIIDGETDFNYMITKNLSGTLSGADIDADTDIELVAADILENPRGFECIGWIFGEDSQKYMFLCGGGQRGQEIITGHTNAPRNTIATLKFQTSTSTWNDTTNFAIYGVRR